MRSRVRTLLTFFMFASILSVVGAAVLGFIAYRSYASNLKPPDQEIAANTIGQSIAYDRNGQFVYQYVDDNGGLRQPVHLGDISMYMIAATVATEDSSFFSNPGVNFRGLARAAVENFTPFGPGFLEGSGGSSITQQLVKNVYVDQDQRLDRRIERKIKEAVIALELKRNYEDNQILEWYINTIAYGGRAYGVQAAAQQYFAKDAKDLTLAESALLAGLPQAPGSYYPFGGPDSQRRAKERQQQVLDLMSQHHNDIKQLIDIPQEQIDAARTEPITYVENNTDIHAPQFSLFVQDQVQKMCQAGQFKAPGDIPCDNVVTQGGLRITSTLDLNLQGIGEKVVEDNIAANESRYNGHNGSLVAMRPGTGEILTYVGSRSYWREDLDGFVDIATSLQSHGSTMKVFTYLTAFQEGWVPSTYVEDAKLVLDVGSGKKEVNNWNFSFLGKITARKALSESVNTAAVRTLLFAGEDNMRDMAHRLGITDLRQGDCGPTVTLGACEVKLVDMTFAFSTIANMGTMKGRPTSEDLPSGYRELDPVSVLKIEDADGNLLYQYSKPEERQVLEPAYAYMVTDILSKDAINWSRLTTEFPAASKTGTSEEFRDGVVMGYSPDLAVGVWMGNADNSPMSPGTFSSAGTGPMWRAFMNQAHEYLKLPDTPFKKPADVVTSSCGGKEEVFKSDEQPSAPGSCRAPAPKPTGPTPVPTPQPPVFPPRNTPTPTPGEETPVPDPTGAGPAIFRYTVKDGDSLTSIAEKYDISAKELAAYNDLQQFDDLIIGQVILIVLTAENPE